MGEKELLALAAGLEEQARSLNEWAGQIRALLGDRIEEPGPEIDVPVERREPEPLVEPEPERAVVRSGKGVVNRVGDRLSFQKVCDTAHGLGEFTKRELTEALSLKPIDTSKLVTQMSERALVTSEDDAERGVVFTWQGVPVEAAEEVPEAEAPPERAEANDDPLGQGTPDAVEEVLLKEGALSAKRLREILGVGNVGGALWTLEEQKRIHRSDRKEQKTGQVRFEIGPDPATLKGEGRRPTEGSDGTPSEEGASSREPSLSNVRDFVISQNGNGFELSKVHQSVGGDVSELRAHLDLLLEQDVIEDVSPLPDMALYQYKEPSGPEVAAARKAQQERMADPTETRKGEPVAGTGRATLPKNEHVRALVVECRELGYEAEPAASGHWAITGDNIKRVLISSTPRSKRSVDNDRSRLKRQGVAL